MRRTLFILLFSLIITAVPAASFAQSEDTPVPGAGAVYCPQLSQTMVRGARDRTTVPPGQVTELQKFISDYYDVDPDDIVTGYFGVLTHGHVIRFQREQNLPAFGIVGPLTRAAIARVCGDNPPPAAQSCNFNGKTIADGTSFTAYASSTIAYGGQCKSETRTCIKGVLTGSYQQPSCSVSNPNPAENNNCSFNGQTILNGSSVVAYQASSAVPGGACVSERRYCVLGTLTGSYGYATCTVGSNFTEPPRSCTQDGITVAHGASRIFYNTRTVNSAGACTAASEMRACNDGTLSGSYPYASCTPTGSASLPPVLSFSSKDAKIAPGKQTTLTWSATNAAWCSAGGGWSGTKATSGAEATATLWGTTNFTLACFSTDGLTSATKSVTVSVIPEEPAQTCSFNGQTILNGSSVVAYQASSAVPGGACVSERRYCVLGTLTGSYGYATCTVGSNFPEPPRSCTQDGVTVAHGASRVFYNTRTVNSAGACTAASELRACNDGTLSGSFPYASCTPNPTVGEGQFYGCTFNGQTIADGASITAYASSAVPAGGQCMSETRSCTRGVLSGSYAYSSCTVSAGAAGPTTDRQCTPNMASTWNAVPSNGTAPLSVTVTFYAVSYYPWDSIDFGDGTKWAVPVPTNGESIYNSQGYACVRHTYVTPGMYTIWHTYGGNHVGGNIYQPNPTITVY